MAKTIVKQKIVHGHAWKKVHKNIQQKASQPFPSTNYVQPMWIKSAQKVNKPQFFGFKTIIVPVVKDKPKKNKVRKRMVR